VFCELFRLNPGRQFDNTIGTPRDANAVFTSHFNRNILQVNGQGIAGQ
jgi:hypothetical protein